MTEKEREPEGVKVVDRRRFTSEGEVRPDADRASTFEPSPQVPPPEPARRPQIPPRPSATEPARPPHPAAQAAGSAAAAQADFETLVVSLSTSALLQLGLVDDPKLGRVQPDLEAARHTIDMLSVIQEKTRGNLSAKETALLEQVLYELRMAFLHVAEGAPPGFTEPDA
ncbi:MAG: DUF1844 domain-containing protein [Terriglobia bacterium]